MKLYHPQKKRKNQHDSVKDVAQRKTVTQKRIQRHIALCIEYFDRPYAHTFLNKFDNIVILYFLL